MSGQTLQYPTREVMKLNDSGKGWMEEVVQENTPPRTRDCCDMVLTRTVTHIKQIYNNYGAFNNQAFLSTYGFIDKECQTDTVCLRAELFDNDTQHFHPDPERCDWWKQNGPTQILALAKNYPDHERELEFMYETTNMPNTPDEFVSWSLTVGQLGWIRFPLKIWGILHLLSPEEWDQFKVHPNSIIPKIMMFETAEVPDSEFPFYQKWLSLFDWAVTARYKRFDDAADHQQWMLAGENYKERAKNDPDQVRPLY